MGALPRGTIRENQNSPLKFSSFFDGNMPVLQPGITVIGDIVHGNRIKIISDGSVNFGDSPDPFFATDLKNAPGDGASFEIEEGVTVRTGYIAEAGCTHVNNTPHRLKIFNRPEMPCGKAFALGGQETVLKGLQAGGTPDFSTPSITGQMEVVASRRKSEQFFITMHCLWPADEQRNAMENSVLNEQIKDGWVFNGSDGHGGGSVQSPPSNDYLNLYFALFSGSGGGKWNGATYTIINSTTVEITLVNNSVHKFMKGNTVGKTIELSSLTGPGIAGTAVIAAVSGASSESPGDTVTLTVAGWPASGSGTMDILKRGDMQTNTRILRSNQAGYIANSNTDYLANMQGALAKDPITIDSTHQRTELCIFQVWVVAGKVTNTVHARIISTVDGEIYNYTEYHPRVPTLSALRDLFEIYHFPGNVQGHGIYAIPGNPVQTTGKAKYHGDLFLQMGDHAASRVELIDTADNGVTTKGLSNFITEYWSPYYIEATVMEGVFTGKPKTGLTVQVLRDNVKVAGKTL